MSDGSIDSGVRAAKSMRRAFEGAAGCNWQYSVRI